jgi:hypothetical protein
MSIHIMHAVWCSGRLCHSRTAHAARVEHSPRSAATILRACLLPQAATPAGPANLQEYLAATKATRFAELLAAAKVDARGAPASEAATLFVPSDAALLGLAASMGLSWDELKARPQLAEAIAAAHLLPG